MSESARGHGPEGGPGPSPDRRVPLPPESGAGSARATGTSRTTGTHTVRARGTGRATGVGGPATGAGSGPTAGAGSDTLVLKRVGATGGQAAQGEGNTAAGHAGNGAKPAAKRRDPFFDNAKYLAILLVAMGHAWEPLRGDSRAASALYIFVYTFHMPAFIIISGYMSRSFDMRPDRLRRLITGVAVPYVLFEVAYTLLKRTAGGDPDYPFSLLDPWYLTWFLIALFVWRLTTPIWKLVRWPVPLALAIAILAAISPDIGDDLDMQRVLQFLPFFVVGLKLKPEHFQLVRRREARILSVPVLVGGALFAYWAAPRMNAAWFYHRDSAQELGAPGWTGVVMTLALFGCSLVLTACFLAWVPRRHMWFTALGAGTLYGYLLHGFLAKGSRFGDWYAADWLHSPAGEIAVTLIAASVITVLCTPLVQRLFKFAMEPEMRWAFRRDVEDMAKRR